MALTLNQRDVRLNPGWPNAGSLKSQIPSRRYHYFGEDSGLYQITGTVKVDGSPDTPVARLVVLFDQLGLRPLRSTWSDGTTGAYTFTKIANKKYMVMSFDHTHNFRAVVADQVTPDLMP